MAQHWHLLWIAGALFLIAYMGSPRQTGKRAFARVRRILEQSLGRRRYHQFHGVRLPTGGGSDVLDHLVVSRFGVFVIVSEFRPGQLSGGESQELWKQKKWGRVHRWPNPVHRAKLHVDALRRNLDLPENRITPLVVIDGQGSLPANLPPQVMRVEQLVPHIRAQRQELLTAEQADRLAAAIAHLQLPRSRGLSRTTAVRIFLSLALAVGVYKIYGDDIAPLFDDFGAWAEKTASPGNFREDGERKSEQQLFEESLACAWSPDTGRCACYQPGGEKAEISLERCRELAERGSILKQ